MEFNSKLLENIQEEDLENLKNRQVAEGKMIEYKLSLPSNSDADKKEFLADISSFANASGGSLLFGILEKEGIPVEIPGLAGINPDAEIARLENIIRDGIDPRVPSIVIRALKLASNNFVIMVRMPRSWALPHMISFQSSSKFYSRNSAGKYQLDISELKAAFEISGTIVERIRRFRAERLGVIVAGEGAVPLPDGAKIIFHLIPLNAFDPSVIYEMEYWDKNSGEAAPLHVQSWDYRYNFDGFLTFSPIGNDKFSRSYLQIFRNGIIEAVNASILRVRNGEGVVPSTMFEQILSQGFCQLLKMQQKMMVPTPIFVMLSLVGVKGYKMGVDPSRFIFANEDSLFIDRDILIVSEKMLEKYDDNTAAIMKPIFDDIWRAAGWAGSPNYPKY